MDDIIWDKTKRFVVAPDVLDFPIIILSDIAFWNSHYEELIDWCDLNNAEVVGMTVEFENERALTLFCLRWSQ